MGTLFKIMDDQFVSITTFIFQYYAKEKKCGKLRTSIILPNMNASLFRISTSHYPLTITNDVK